MRRALAAALLVAALAAAGAARAGTGRVVLVGVASDPVAARVRAELEALGFEVVDAPGRDAAGRAALEDAARAAGGVAAVRLAPSGDGVEVWIADRVTGKSVVRRIDATPGEPASPGTLAVRAVELLRASLLEIDAPGASRGEVAPTPELREFARSGAGEGPASHPSGGAQSAGALAGRPARVAETGGLERPTPSPELGRTPIAPARFAFAVGPALGVAPGGTPAAVLLDVRARWMPSPRAGIGATALAPTWGSHVAARAGAAVLHWGLVGAGAHLELAPTSRLAPALELGCAAAWLSARGSEAAASYTVLGATTWTIAPYARAGAGLRLGGAFALRADGFVAVTGSRAHVQVAGADVARWGAALVGASLALETLVP